MLIKKQEKTFTHEYDGGDVIIATIKHDDRCNNGHNTFSVTGEIYDRDFISREVSILNSNGKRRYLGACGCLHEEISKHFPALSPCLKFHLCATDGPLYYIENTLYWAGKRGDFQNTPNIDHFRSSSIFPDAPDSILDLSEREIVAILNSRLPGIMEEFRKTVESFGFIYQ